MYLMLKDTKVLYFHLEDFVVETIREDLLPYCLRSNIRGRENNKDILHNIEEVKSYLSSRVLSLSRDNAKQIYAAFQIPQSDSIDNRVNICIKCKGVSIQDSYWIREEDENLSWSHVNIRQNKLRDIIDLSLSGVNPTITTSNICPELTTKGLFRKGWIRLGENLYLLKSDKNQDNVNTRMEVLASDILGCFKNRIETVAYVSDIKNTVDGEALVSICKNFVGEKYSFVEAWEVMEYVKRCGMDFTQYCMERWPRQFASIPVLDYIILNTDRHTQNYGFLMNNETGEIEQLAPLFDFNCALTADYFQRDAADTLSQMFNTADTLRELAYRFVQDTNMIFYEEKFNRLSKSIMYQKYQYIFERVYDRIRELGIV